MKQEKITADQLKEILKPKKRQKYGAKKIIIDGITFDSTKEGKRYSTLKNLLTAGLIKDLVLQPKFRFVVNNIEITSYKPDFKYFDIEQNKMIYEDVKSTATRTRDYLIKVKCMKAFYGIEITES